MDQQIEQKIVERGQEFFNSISGEAPSIFNKGWWTGKVMDWSMKNEDFKVQLFRFVDVLPYLNTSESLLRHIREYFASSGSEVPSVLRWGAGKAGLGGALTAKIMGGAIRSNIESMGRAPGEHNVLFYQPKGVAAVIAPWNFPFAIAMGMVSAAIVTGNPVVFKPSSLSSAIGYNLVEIFKEVGLPAGVFNYCPGQSSVMGDYLVEHPDISLICFTGSMDVGLHIVEKAAKVQPGQRQVKRVIAEMGGKNATIVDDDADLDEAVSQVVYSAFGFQGQKCSACSRVIVLDAIYDTFVQRLALAAQSLRIGPAENPENFLGPLADASLQKNVLEYIEIAEAEGKTLVKRSDLPDKGAYVPLLIVEDVMPEHRIAQEEVFGPVLAVMRAKDFDEALELALSTRFALTGAVFSRSPENLAKAREKFRVGNLYLNKGSTGAMVGRPSSSRRPTC